MSIASRLNTYNFDLTEYETEILDLIVNDIFYIQTHLDNVKDWNQVYDIPVDVNGDRIVRNVKRCLKLENIHVPVELSEDRKSVVCTVHPFINMELREKYEGSHGRSLRDVEKTCVSRRQEVVAGGMLKRSRSSFFQ